ncbi:MAG: YaaR family protein [Clostridia bacterium]|nr:YaaR family protein [Clostridia bacterium]
MKISNVKSKTVASPIFNVSVETNEVESTEKLFRAHFDDILEQDAIDFVEGKMREINEVGEKLCEKADIALLNRYKGLIQELMRYTVSNGYKFSKSNSFDARGRGKVYGLIKKVNNKLEELTEMVLDEERDNLEVVASINDIRGMLVDMLM